MSTPSQSHATLSEVKHRANINTSVTDKDTKLQTFLNSADNYVNTQIRLHATIPIVDPDPELVSLASSLAASEYDYWISSERPQTLENSIKHWQSRIQDFIMATYGRKNPSMLSGGKTFGTTGQITGRSR